MGIHQFLGQVKAGDGMEAIERESNRLGVKNIVRGARVGLKVASQLLPGKYGDTATAAGKALREFIGRWAINYLEANYQSNFADNTEHGSIDWMVKTSSLDPEERVVTQHL
eukprot:SAG22_NODE_232_length_14402_cov_58.042159_1_plen_111_part_00